MTNWKRAFGICLTLLLATILFASYKIFSQAITLNYYESSSKVSEKDFDELIDIINETDLSKQEIQKELSNSYTFETIQAKIDTITLDRVHLIFNGNQLSKIEKHKHALGGPKQKSSH